MIINIRIKAEKELLSFAQGSDGVSEVATQERRIDDDLHTYVSGLYMRMKEKFGLSMGYKQFLCGSNAERWI